MAGQPRDAEMMISIFRSMGVTHYEPRVIHQLLEYMHRFCTEVFHDSGDYAMHAGRPGQLECEDVHLALKLKAAAAQPTTVSFTEWMASETNRQPLPAAAQVPGVQLPLQKLCLLTPNYQLKLPSDAKRIPRPQPEPALPKQPGTAPPRKKPRGRKAIAIHVEGGAAAAPPEEDEDMWEE
jgi:transcription initiation factor TFIID subunit 9B|tara:strand:- start:4874 stop:5413 length:540 start_codon:yes stop_codon:yes gene_type:complete